MGLRVAEPYLTFRANEYRIVGGKGDKNVGQLTEALRMEIRACQHVRNRTSA